MFKGIKEAVSKAFGNPISAPENTESGVPFYPFASNSRPLSELSRTDYLRLYQSWVFLCVSTIADAVAELEFAVKKGELEIEHPAKELVTPELLRELVSHMLLTGTAYYYKEKIGKKVDGLELLRADLVYIEENEDGSLKNFRYDGGRKSFTFQPEDVIDFSLFNPLRSFPYTVKGVSPVSAIAIQAEMDRTANRWNWNFFRNGATIGGTLESDEDIDEDSKSLIVSKWKEKFGGVNNSHSIALLDKGLKYKAIPVSKREMDFVESKRLTRDEILAIFKVPPAVVGLTDNANRASATVALETFYRICVSPLASQIASVITKELFAGVGKFEFVNVVPVDTEALRADFLGGAITLNEYRRGRGYAPLKGGDSLNDGSEAVPEKTPEKSVFQKAFEYEILAKVPGTEAHRKSRDEYGMKKWDAKVFRLRPAEEKFARYVSYVFDEQKRDILAEILGKKSKEFKMPEKNPVKWRLLWMGLSGIYKEVVQSEGTATLSELGLSSVFVTGDPDVNKFVKESTSLLSKSADAYTVEKITEIIVQANDE